MQKNGLTRLIALGAFAGVCLCPVWAEAASISTDKFVAACSKDPIITDDSGFDDGKVTPKAYCECVAAEIVKNNLSQKDVDMLIKMHNEDISDADVESYPSLEDLMNANEGYEDNCRKTLGLPTDDSETDIEENPEDEMTPGDMSPEDDEGPPAEEDEQPPE
jgi:hypothetical protein